MSVLLNEILGFQTMERQTLCPSCDYDTQFSTERPGMQRLDALYVGDPSRNRLRIVAPVIVGHSGLSNSSD
jgi:hypothetical protein